MIGRRDFIAGLGGAVAWPLVARAQQPAAPRIGFLSSGSPETDGFRTAPFRAGLNETGYVEGRNVAIEFRWAAGRYDRLPALAAELVRHPVALIVAGGTPTAVAAKAATTTIPIVFTTGSDPVKLGLVASFNRPGGNATGASVFVNVIGSKSLEWLHQLVPKAVGIGILVNPSNPNTESETREAQEAARSLGLRLHILHASAEREIDAGFAAVVNAQAGALIVQSDPFFNNRSNQIVALAAQHAMPAIYAWPEIAAAGGLMSYGTSNTDAYHQVGVYTGRILKGEKPADLPVVRPTKIGLTINLKTAKALGLTIPETLLATADEVIQ
jgi:putative tryptophan/tyrosine transport system substrate-binding protein